MSIISTAEDDASTSTDVSGESQFVTTDFSSQHEFVDQEEVEKLSQKKKEKVMSEQPVWRENIRQQMEEELNRRVREALETPPIERTLRHKTVSNEQRINELNSHINLEFERNFFKNKRWKSLQSKQHLENCVDMSYLPSGSQVEFMFHDELSRSNHDEYPGVYGLESCSEGLRNIRDNYSCTVDKLSPLKPKARHFFTKQGFLHAIRTGELPNGFVFLDELGTYRDRYGIIRNEDGPFWPSDFSPLHATPRFKWFNNLPMEPFFTAVHNVRFTRTIDNQVTQFTGKWRGVLVAYDSERSPRETIPQVVPEGCVPNLVFESRFESGNLRQARRIGQYEYELVLKTDLYTTRHTQWFYFRVQNAVPGVTYKFRIVNLLKRDSLYNYGMRPLFYSEINAQEKKIGWVHTGHHINYSRNILNLHCPLLQRGVVYYMLEWQMEFTNTDDCCYLAHCYPYTFTDLKEHLDSLVQSPERQQFIKREVLCETRAGNSCFLLTVTNFKHIPNGCLKKVVVVSARVHPGESQSSWMMKGVLDFITGPDAAAKELRNKFIFKIVPMLNPDGVIVGNYRCSLSARDLNRNYRHPRQDSFPTVWHVKNMIEILSQKYEVLLYCDLHGHSRKHNTFMYGNNTSENDDENKVGVARAFINERLFPWLMSQKAPERFSFPSCKFYIRKCKESTGRVVMWRQLKIQNSFTLEATFSGTIIDQSNCRHFNINDFQSMGSTLCQAVLDYNELQENKARQTEVVLDLTRVMTQQILVSRGLLPPNIKLPNFAQIANFDKDADVTTVEAQTIQEDAEKWTEAVLDLLAREKENSNVEDKQKTAKKEDKNKGRSLRVEEKQPSLTRKEVNELIDNVSLKTMDGCMNILAELNVREAIEQSDSSDSDSESEPEMKAEVKRKKKRKSKKQRDHDKKITSEKKERERDREKVMSSLPALVSDTNAPTTTIATSISYSSNHLYRSKANALDKYMKMSTKPHFISKYEGRSNGGMPCFTEERSRERQAMRLAEIKKKHEEDRQHDLAFYFLQENQVQRSLTTEDFNRRLQVALNEGTSNVSQALVGINIRTSYTHADDKLTLPVASIYNFQEVSPSVPSSNGFLCPSHQSQTFKREISTSDSDTEAETSIYPMFPISSRKNPYSFDSMAQSLAFPNPLQPLGRKLRTGPVLKSVSRRIKSSTPPLISSTIVPGNRSPISDHVASHKVVERQRIGHQQPTIMKGIRIQGIGQGPWD
ncbi:uncharacterized protein LOC121377854 [Gigantopelta aegis]|uniref:uncharacterized protein LOC121377854 n=1 Tax=Gigantopelta aegis TaxID=1735272 RepID=UPI001B88A08C|nr:uncharacterized protein LOC121377854 [Gigantopelta aegis]